MKKIVLIATAIIFTMSSCKKEEYQPKGDYQVAGNYQESGDYVISGENNNTIKNYDLTITPSQWSYNNLYDQHYYTFPCTEKSNSAIMCYIISGNGKQIMPYIDKSGSSDEIYTFADNLYATSPHIEFQYINNTSITTGPQHDKYVYIVVIPVKQMQDNPNVNWENYNEVKEVFNLNESEHIELVK